jgi:hypothetical protein
LFGISFFVDENFNIFENNIFFAKDSSDSGRPKIPLNKAPPENKIKKRTKGTQVGLHGYLWRVVAKPSLFFWLNLSIWLKEISIWLNPFIYIFWVCSQHIFTIFLKYRQISLLGSSL